MIMKKKTVSKEDREKRVARSGNSMMEKQNAIRAEAAKKKKEEKMNAAKEAAANGGAAAGGESAP